MTMISNAFRQQFGRHVLVTNDGKLCLTALGRAELGPKFARHGFDVTCIRSLEAFTNAMSVINDLEFEANTESLLELSKSETLTDVERDVLASLLGVSAASPAPARPALHLV